MNETTASTENNAIVISDDDLVAQPLNDFIIAAISPVSMGPTAHSRPVIDEHVASSTEEEEENEGNVVQPNEDVERVQPTKSAEGADDDDFRPAKKRKVQESDDVEVDEVRTLIWSLWVTIVVTCRANCVQYV